MGRGKVVIVTNVGINNIEEFIKKSLLDVSSGAHSISINLYYTVCPKSLLEMEREADKGCGKNSDLVTASFLERLDEPEESFEVTSDSVVVFLYSLADKDKTYLLTVGHIRDEELTLTLDNHRRQG